MHDPRQPLLYLTHRIPYPPNKGDKVRSFNILRQLACHYRVFLGTFVDQPEDRQHVAALSQWCEGTHVVELDTRLARLASLRGLLSDEALSLAYYRNATLARWVHRTVSEQGITRAVAFSGPMAQYLDVRGLNRRVIDFCDVDSVKWAQYAARHRWPMSRIYGREGARLLAFERRAAAMVDTALFVTEAEANLFRSAAPEVAKKVHVMRNGVDADFFSPAHAFPSPYPAGGPVLAFTGAMDYWPNIDGVTWFTRQILPRIRERQPDIRFWIVGMNPAAAVQALAEENVMVTGAVPDVRPYVAHANVIVASLRVARGIQNKVLEAMAMARPVVMSTAAAMGLTAKSGRECEIADGEDTFVSSILCLLRQPGTAEAMGAAARMRVLSEYSWQTNLACLDELLGTSKPLPQAVSV